MLGTAKDVTAVACKKQFHQSIINQDHDTSIKNYPFGASHQSRYGDIQKMSVLEGNSSIKN